MRGCWKPLSPASDVKTKFCRDPSPYTLLGVGNVLSWSAPSEASIRHVRISYGRQPQTQMHVSWTSDDSITPGLVQLGTAPGVYDLPAVPAAVPLTYSPSDSCGAPKAYSPPGYFYHALVAGLRPATRYYARVMQVRRGVWAAAPETS